MEFQRELEEAKQELDEGDAAPHEELDTAAEGKRVNDDSVDDFREEMSRLGEVSPKSVVMESHARLENLLRNSIEIPAGEERRPAFLSMRSLVRQAVKQNLLTAREAAVADELSHLRNRVAHEPDEVITPDSAVEYANLVLQVAVAVRLALGQTVADGPVLP